MTAIKSCECCAETLLKMPHGRFLVAATPEDGAASQLPGGYNDYMNLGPDDMDLDEHSAAYSAPQRAVVLGNSTASQAEDSISRLSHVSDSLSQHPVGIPAESSEQSQIAISVLKSLQNAGQRAGEVSMEIDTGSRSFVQGGASRPETAGPSSSTSVLEALRRPPAPRAHELDRSSVRGTTTDGETQNENFEWERSHMAGNATEHFQHDMTEDQPTGNISEASLPQSYADLSNAPRSTARDAILPPAGDMASQIPALPKSALSKKASTVPFIDPNESMFSNPPAPLQPTNGSDDLIIPTGQSPKKRNRISWGDGNLSQQTTESQRSAKRQALDRQISELPSQALSPGDVLFPDVPRSRELRQHQSMFDDEGEASGNREPELFLPPRTSTISTHQQADSRGLSSLNATSSQSDILNGSPMVEETQPIAQGDDMPELMDSTRDSDIRKRFGCRGKQSLNDLIRAYTESAAGEPVPSPNREPILPNETSFSSPGPGLGQDLMVEFAETQQILANASRAGAGYGLEEDSQGMERQRSSSPPIQLAGLHNPEDRPASPIAEQDDEANQVSIVVPDSEEGMKSFSAQSPPPSQDIPLAGVKLPSPKRSALAERQIPRAGPSSSPRQPRSRARESSPLSDPAEDPNNHFSDMEETNYDALPTIGNAKTSKKAKKKAAAVPAKPVKKKVETKSRKTRSTTSEAVASTSKATKKKGKKAAVDESTMMPPPGLVIASGSKTTTRTRPAADQSAASTSTRASASKKNPATDPKGKGKAKAIPSPADDSGHASIDQQQPLVDEPTRILNQDQIDMGIEDGLRPDLPYNRFFVKWPVDKCFYPADIVEVEHDRVKVRFSDETETTVSYRDLRQLKLRNDDPIQYAGYEETQQATEALYDTHRVYEINWADLSGQIVPEDTVLGSNMICAVKLESKPSVKRRWLVAAIKIPYAPKENANVLADRMLTEGQINSLKASAPPDPLAGNAALIIRNSSRSTRGSSAAPAVSTEARKSASTASRRSASTVPPAENTRTTPTRSTSASSSRSVRQQGNLFKGYGFLLTGFEERGTPTEERNGPPTMGHYRTTDKAALQHRVLQEGGVIVDDMSDLVMVIDDDDGEVELEFKTSGKFSKLENIYLLADRPFPSEKYLMAVALGVPCLSTAWIDESHEHKKLLDPWDFSLGSGYSYRLGCTFAGRQAKLARYDSFSLTDLKAPERLALLQIFSGRRFLLVLPSEEVCLPFSN